MYVEFKTHDLGNGYTLVEPPAGLLPYINKRIKSYTGDENDQLTQANWATIFVLACLHYGDMPVAVDVFSKLEFKCDYPTAINTLRSVYVILSDTDFKLVVEEFQFSITRDKLTEWFDAVDEMAFISKKKVDAEKND